VETLTERGVLLRSLREGIDYSTPTGRMLAGIFTALAGYERELMHERAAAARQAARPRGRHTGRPPRLTAAQVRQLRALRADGESIGELGRSFGPGHRLPRPAAGPGGSGSRARVRMNTPAAFSDGRREAALHSGCVGCRAAR
jgi:hypothetical protein